MSKQCAIYVRISLDRIGAGLGVDRQEKACREYAAKMGWEVVEVYIDNDVSASNRRKPRPAYRRMVADVKAGKVTALIVWHIDRLTRQPRELEDVIDLADEHGLALGTVEGEVDLATPTGRLVARIMGATARHEAEHKGQRQKLAHQQAAEAGKPHMGGPRPYGYLPDRVTVDASEGAFVAVAARRVLAGESLRSVACWMNDEGAKTVTGKAWSAPLLKQVLRSARISGRREVKGVVVADGAWQPIISVEQSDRLRALFADPTRMAHQRSTRPKHLLTGLLTCGRCGGRMTCLKWEAGGKHLYRCPSNGSTFSKQTCGRLSVLAKHAEPVVRNVVLEALDSPDLHHRLAAAAEVDPGVAEAVQADEQRLEDLAAEFGAGNFTMAEWKVAREAVQARLTQNKALLARASQTDALRLLDGNGALEDRWAALNVAQQRAVLAEVLEQVKVQPAAGRGLAFDPRRLEPTFRF